MKYLEIIVFIALIVMWCWPVVADYIRLKEIRKRAKAIKKIKKKRIKKEKRNEYL